MNDRLRDFDLFDADEFHVSPVRLKDARQFLDMFLNHLKIEDFQVVPSFDGGVQLEWHSAPYHAEILFSSADGVEIYTYVDEQP